MLFNLCCEVGLLVGWLLVRLELDIQPGWMNSSRSELQFQAEEPASFKPELFLFLNSWMLLRLAMRGCAVHFQWVPAHVGLAGNEKADALAKKALQNALRRKKAAMRDPVSFSSARTALLRLHREQYNADPGEASLYAEHTPDGRLSYLAAPRPPAGLSRKHEVHVRRLRTGHHKLLRDYPDPSQLRKCAHCPTENCTVEHLLLLCPARAMHRRLLPRGLSVRRLLWEHQSEVAAYLEATADL